MMRARWMLRIGRPGTTRGSAPSSTRARSTVKGGPVNAELRASTRRLGGAGTDGRTGSVGGGGSADGSVGPCDQRARVFRGSTAVRAVCAMRVDAPGLIRCQLAVQGGGHRAVIHVGQVPPSFPPRTRPRAA